MRAAIRGSPPLGETPQPVLVLTVHLRLGSLGQLALGNNHDVEGDAARERVAPEALAKEPLGPVASGGRPDLAAHGEPQPVPGAAVLRGHELKERPIEALPGAEDAPELPRRLQPLLGPEPPAQAESRFRPFCRRRLSTSRPPFVRIRTRKPWVRFRFRLFGWNVLFMIEPRPPGASGVGRKPLLPGQTRNYSASSLRRQIEGPRDLGLGLVSARTPVVPFGLQGSDRFQPSVVPVPAFPQVLKSLCKRGFSRGPRQARWAINSLSG